MSRRIAKITRLLSRLTQRSSSNFMFAFVFLGAKQRKALETVYEFCRVVDDIVDEREPGAAGIATAREQLSTWTSEVASIWEDPYRESQGPQTDLGRALQAAKDDFDIPREALDEIIAGVAMDLERSLYDDGEQLRLYCYRVASCVGFLCIAIFGDTSPAAQRYAEHLGLALQYTNILRDVAEDAGRKRVYLPADLLERHGMTHDDVLQQRYDDRFVAMATDFAEAAEREYRHAWAALDDADLRRLLPAEVMGRTYYRILVEIRARNFNVFTRRATLRRRDKLKAAAVAIARTGLSAL